MLQKGDAVDARHGSGEVRSATIKHIEGDTHTVVFDRPPKALKEAREVDVSSEMLAAEDAGKTPGYAGAGRRVVSSACFATRVA